MGYLGSKVLLRIERDSLSAPVVWEAASVPCLHSMPPLWVFSVGLPSGMGQICCFSPKTVWQGNEPKKPLSALAATALPAQS